ncbi:MAG: hypothetical protein M3384_00745, partial [Acidobacteriota bacterium]|nr:hypothetical protein [Acidobacteriota bacterium]
VMSDINKLSTVKFFSALAILTSLFFSSVFAPRTKVEAAAVENNSAAAAVITDTVTTAGLSKTPMIFEANRGQTDGRAEFISRGQGYTLYLTKSEAVFSLKPQNAEAESARIQKTKSRAPETVSRVLRMSFAGASAETGLAGGEQMPMKTNYYAGKKKFDNIPNYRQVRYRNLYDGIDAVFYGNEKQLEYDFVVAPEANPNRIRLKFDGVDKISLNAGGDLILAAAETEIIHRKPYIYQESDNRKQEIAGRYILLGNNEVGFEIGAYDRSRTLVIDPILRYSTYVGGTELDRIADIAVDAAGNAYLVGDTRSLDFPSPGARVASDEFGIFVGKLDPTGNNFVYLTFLEGEEDDLAQAIAIDGANNAYITGFSHSEQYPTTAGAFKERKSFCAAFPFPTTCYAANEDVVVTKLNAAGNLDVNGSGSFSTYLGGGNIDQSRDIAVAANGRAYVAGMTLSGGFDKKNEFQGCGVSGSSAPDAFLTVFNAAGTDLVYSTCLGGNGGEESANGVAIDAAGNAYLAGITDQNDFPVRAAFQPERAGGTDAFVAKINPNQVGDASLIYSSYLGGSGTDEANAVAVSAAGAAHLTGVTGSFNFPLKNAFDSLNQVNEAFVTTIHPSGSSITNSSFLGGSDQDFGFGIAVNSGGAIYVTGRTLSNNFPLALPFQSSRRGLFDAFVTKLRFGGEAPGVSWSSFYGGNRGDFSLGIAVRGNHVYIAGETESSNLTTVSPNPGGALKPASNANEDARDGFVAKILDTRKDTIGVFNPSLLQFQLRNTLTAGAPDITVNRGAAGDLPVAGDFNGDGIDTVSTFNNGTWTLRNFNVASGGYPAPVTPVQFGQPGDLPVVGDWNNDGIDSIGVYRPSAGQFFLSNSNTVPAVDITITFGAAEDLPVAGDWNGDGTDTVGVFRPSVADFFLTNQNILNPNVDITAFFGVGEDLPVAGDFDGNGTDTIGVWRPSVRTFFLTNNNADIAASVVFGSNGDRPVIGDWDGKPNQ